ncbi:unnamed protein product [Urochloa humidicola]
MCLPPRRMLRLGNIGAVAAAYNIDSHATYRSIATWPSAHRVITPEIIVQTASSSNIPLSLCSGVVKRS